MAEFKVGDVVRINNNGKWRGIGEIGKIEEINLNRESGHTHKVRYEKPDRVGDTWCWHKVTEFEQTKLKEVPPTRFILQYELDKDPFETFATMKEVEARIKELAKRPDLKRESIKVYEVAKTFEVKLETRVIFGTKVTLDEKPVAKKRGRPVGSKNKKK